MNFVLKEIFPPLGEAHRAPKEGGRVNRVKWGGNGAKSPYGIFIFYVMSLFLILRGQNFQKINLMLKEIFSISRGGPQGSRREGGGSGKSGKLEGKWGKIPVWYFYFLCHEFIFNST